MRYKSSPYLGSNISSTENDVNIRIGKALNAINRLMTIWRYDLSGKIKRDFFFHAGAISVLLHGCTTSTLTEILI